MGIIGKLNCSKEQGGRGTFQPCSVKRLDICTPLNSTDSGDLKSGVEWCYGGTPQGNLNGYLGVFLNPGGECQHAAVTISVQLSLEPAHENLSIETIVGKMCPSKS